MTTGRCVRLAGFALALAVIIGTSQQLGARQFQNPIQAAKDAYNKAKQQSQQQQQQQKQQQRQQQQQQGQAQGQQASPSTSASDDSAPFNPPAESTGAAPVAIDVSKLPDVGGVKPGMTAMEAYKALQGGDPKVMPQIHSQLMMPTMQGGQLEGYSVGFDGTGRAPVQELVFLTPPPDKQVVWRVTRELSWPKMFRMNAVTSLREKYGQEAATYSNGNAVDAEHAQTFYWLFDGQGRPQKWPSGNAATSLAVVDNCRSVLGGAFLYDYLSWFAPSNIMMNEAQMADGGWCNTMGFMVVAQLNPEEIITRMAVQVVAMPIAAPAARSEIAWLKDVSRRLYQQQVDESKKAKPSL